MDNIEITANEANAKANALIKELDLLKKRVEFLEEYIEKTGTLPVPAENSEKIARKKKVNSGNKED